MRNVVFKWRNVACLILWFFGNVVKEMWFWKCRFGNVVNVSPVYFCWLQRGFKVVYMVASLRGIIWLAQSVFL